MCRPIQTLRPAVLPFWAPPTAPRSPRPIGKILIAFRLAGHAAIRERFERARAEGDLPADADPKALTHYIGTVVCGMAVLAASGATRKELERVIELTMRGVAAVTTPACVRLPKP